MTKYKGLKTLEVLEGADNYNSWIAGRLKEHIISPAIEIGAGTGNISSYFTNLTDLTITDADPELVLQLKDRFGINFSIKFKVLDISKKISLVDTEKYKTVYSINVLEHIEDDMKALKNMYRLLKKNGKIVLLVPAKKNAFTKLDKKLGHFRRYEMSELKVKLEESGFKLNELNYFNITGLLSWVVRDKITREHNHLKSSHVKIFDWIVPFLKFLEPKNNLPVGISLIAVATKI